MESDQNNNFSQQFQYIFNQKVNEKNENINQGMQF